MDVERAGHPKRYARVSLSRFGELAGNIVLDVSGRHQHRWHDRHARGTLSHQGFDCLTNRGSREFQEARRLKAIRTSLLPRVCEREKFLDASTTPAPVPGN
jgi:hypothetical protein